MDKTIVTVHGEARREVPPEQAVFSVTVSAKDRDKPTVVARLTERAAEVGEILDRYGAAVERRETTGLHVYPEYRRRSERSVTHAGSVTTTVTVSDFDPLGELLAQLAAGESTSVSGPWWQLRPGSRAGADVRREAVTDALERAREYAAAVGSELDRIVEISDAEAADAHPMMMRAAGGMADVEESGLAFDLDPRQQAVEAHVRVRVTITEPTVLRA
ncbi:SIMPL domain-containing protein [Actinoplanes sp. NEAU-A12]|uniref:SIMPL domain-containing protein n=1 Tax=Actinoplanes sandaracinus TaxID=3045177 RepID=A0ABT6WIV1_9ACTN|nr:SIMPL domain-containing protein [Actinoplanes sandaracinus]MDI6099655.1 SIMPL domain-containing protein [Actinoplanes sandaracinus]